MSDLAGRRALVTGGAVRLGRELSLQCAQLGMDVAVHFNRSTAAAEQTAADCRERGVKAVPLGADLGSAEGCRRAVAGAEKLLGGVDVLVNSASNFLARPFEQMDEEELDQVLAVNLKGPFFCAQAAAPGMIARGWGRIVSMADVAGLEPWPSFAAHSVAKAGVVMLTKALAQALAPHVLVNAIAPGTLLMPPGATPESTGRAAEMAVLGRVGEPSDAAGALRYLLEADYVTGHTLVVDGGRLVRP